MGHTESPSPGYISEDNDFNPPQGLENSRYHTGELYCPVTSIHRREWRTRATTQVNCIALCLVFVTSMTSIHHRDLRTRTATQVSYIGLCLVAICVRRI